jgi:hypothetical protein
MTDDRIDYDRINQRVEKRLRERKKLRGLVLAFVVMTAVVWTTYLLVDPMVPPEGKFLWPLIPMVAMGVVVIWRAVEVYFLAEAREREWDDLMEREIERERARLYDEAVLEKPKRDQVAHLSDDGELVYEEDEPVLKSPGRRAR